MQCEIPFARTIVGTEDHASRNLRLARGDVAFIRQVGAAQGHVPLVVFSLVGNAGIEHIGGVSGDKESALGIVAHLRSVRVVGDQHHRSHAAQREFVTRTQVELGLGRLGQFSAIEHARLKRTRGDDCVGQH